MIEESRHVIMLHTSPIVPERSSRSDITTYCQQYYYSEAHNEMQRM